MVIIRIEAVEARAEHGLGGRERLGPVRRAGVDARVQIELGQKHVRSRCRCSAVAARNARVRQVGFDRIQLAHDEVVDVGTLGLFRRRSADRVGFGQQRDVPEEIDAMPITQGPEEPCFGAVRPDGVPERGADAPRGQHGIRRLAQELVGDGDLEEDPVIHHLGEFVVRPPPLSVQLGEALIPAPRNHRLIGRQLLHLPQQAHILREALVGGADVGLPELPSLARDRKTGVHLG